MKLVNSFVNLLSNTVGKWHWPWVEKKFELKDYFEIEKRLRELEVPFAVGCVCTYGSGSNLLIKAGQYFGIKKWSQVTHALAHIGLYNGFRHRVVEAMGEGIREVSLLKAIGQRDVVILRIPNPKLLNAQVCKYAIEYLKDLADRDKEKNIEYDNSHDYENAETLDCSETILVALDYAFKKADQRNPVEMVNRAGKLTWSPAEVRTSKLFVDFYISGKGFV